VVLFQAPDGRVSLDVRLDRETLWLSLNQMSELFDRDKSVVSRHLRNVFAEGELEREATVAFSATVQPEGGRRVTRQVEYYDLDAIISVGYRVNSKRGRQFRIWATSVLREHVVRGYTVNENRLRQLNQAIRLIADSANRRALTGDEATALLRMVADYSYALDLLDDYDHQRVRAPRTAAAPALPVTHDEARRLIEHLRSQCRAGELFGREKDHSLRSSLAAVHQTAGGQEVYPSLAEKAAHLLYFLVKNHPFVDGNKRIGAALFLWFLEKNGSLYQADGRKCLADTALVAMTLLVAESRPADRDALVQVLGHLIARGRQRRNELRCTRPGGRGDTPPVPVFCRAGCQRRSDAAQLAHRRLYPRVRTAGPGPRDLGRTTGDGTRGGTAGAKGAGLRTPTALSLHGLLPCLSPDSRGGDSRTAGGVSRRQPASAGDCPVSDRRIRRCS
jgi:prophage maintenance system killer protein